MLSSDWILIANGVVLLFLTIIGFFVARLINLATSTLGKHGDIINDIEKRMSAFVVRFDVSDDSMDKLQIEIEHLKRDIGKCKDRLVLVESRCHFAHPERRGD